MVKMRPMRGRNVFRTKALPVMTAVAAALLVGVNATSASAGTGQLFALKINDFRDWGNFEQDPYQDIPGDSIRACDGFADGWGVTAYLDSNHNGVFDRTATTSGHPAGYCSPWASGNIPEDATVTLKVCNTKSGYAPKNCKQEDYTA
jgi:hypothetical protein